MPLSGDTPYPLSSPHLQVWAQGRFQLSPAGFPTAWFYCFRHWNYSVLLGPQASGMGSECSQREQALCFVFVSFFIYWSYQRDPALGLLFPHALALQAFAPCLFQVATEFSFLFLFHALPHFLRIGRHFCLFGSV